MSFEIPGQVITLEAGQDLSAKQYYFVSLASDGQVDPTGAGLGVDGVLQDDPAVAGYGALVMINGVSKVVAGAVITRGADVASDASGKAVASTSGDYIVGTALEAATADGDIIAVLITRAGRTA